MSELKGQPGEVHMTIEITRAATGKVETYELVGHVDPEKTTTSKPEEPVKGN